MEIVNIPYNFRGSLALQRYADVVARIKLFPNHTNIGSDESGLYDMYRIELGNPANPTILFNAGMHGTEWYPVQYGMAFMEMLRDNTFPDMAFRNMLLERFHIVYVPVLNPWGYDRTPEVATESYSVARYNVNGYELNKDFNSSGFTQKESRNLRDQILLFQPFSYLDMHMFQHAYNVAYGRNAILGYGQLETQHVRDAFAESWEAYIGEEITKWIPSTNPDSGLSRTYVANLSNEHTPHTLSYITEIVLPTNYNNVYVEKLNKEQIYSYGISSLYLYLHTSVQYFDEHNAVVSPEEPEEETPTNPENPTTPPVTIPNGITLLTLIEDVRSLTRDFSNSIFRESDIIRFINGGISRCKQVIPELKGMSRLMNSFEVVTHLPEEYTDLLVLFATSRCFMQDESFYQATTYMNEFENKLSDLLHQVENGEISIVDSAGNTVVSVLPTDYVVDNYFNRYASADLDEGIEDGD